MSPNYRKARIWLVGIVSLWGLHPLPLIAYDGQTNTGLSMTSQTSFIGQFVNQWSEGANSFRISQRSQYRVRTRGGSRDPQVPYVMSPRNTSVLEGQPVIRWNQVPNANYYDVEVVGPDFSWQKRVTEPQVVYDNNPPLQQGVKYRIIVVANGRSSREDGVVSFTVLDENTITKMRGTITELAKSNLSEEAALLARVKVYQQTELYSIAIDEIQAWLTKGNRSGAVYALLGSLYWDVKLERVARDHYVNGLALLQQNRDLSGQAEALEALGRIDDFLGDVSQTIKWLTEAQQVYQTLNNSAKVQELETKLTELKQRV
jgi:hypothetical protein